MRVPVGPSYDTTPGAGDGLFDQGNNIVLNDDGSMLWSAGSALVRVLDTSPARVSFIADGSPVPAPGRSSAVTAPAVIDPEAAVRGRGPDAPDVDAGDARPRSEVNGRRSGGRASVAASRSPGPA